MRKILLCAGLLFAGSVYGSGIEFWFVAGQTLISNPGLGTDDCPAGEGITDQQCLAIGALPNDIALTDGFHFGFRGGFNSGDHLGYEMGYMYNRTNLKINNAGGQEQGMAYHQVFFNGLWHFTGPDAKVRPFATAGVGFVNYAPPGSSAAYGGGSTRLGIDYGGGVKVKLTDRWGLRFDVRQVTTPKPNLGLLLTSGWLRETELSAGVGIFF